MRTRVHDWLDTNTQKPLYSFQVLVDGKWSNPLKDGKPMLFENKADRDAAQAEARKVRYEL